MYSYKFSNRSQATVYYKDVPDLPVNKNDVLSFYSFRGPEKYARNMKFVPNFDGITDGRDAYLAQDGAGAFFVNVPPPVEI